MDPAIITHIITLPVTAFLAEFHKNRLNEDYVTLSILME
jgi:hypothetical protein